MRSQGRQVWIAIGAVKGGRAAAGVTWRWPAGAGVCGGMCLLWGGLAPAEIGCRLGEI